MRPWLAQAIHHPSPNFDERPGRRQDTNLLVIHNISLPPNQFGGNAINQLFLNQLNPDEHPYYKDIYQMKVSAHLLIRRNGQLIQYVGLDKRAWHAGQSVFCEQQCCNDYSIGIELEGADHVPYTEHQYKQLIKVTKEIRRLYPAITKERIKGHSDIAPGRKTDPGDAFDWKHYLEQL